MTNERRVNDVRTFISDVIVELTRDRTITSNMEANIQNSIPTVDVMLPSGQGDHVTIPHVNLSISGYEPDSLRTSGMRSPSMQAWEVSAIPQMDGPGSLPMRDHIERWMNGIPRLVEQDIQIEMGDPLEEEDALSEDLLMEMEDLLMEEDPLDLLVDKDHLALRDHLDQ